MIYFTAHTFKSVCHCRRAMFRVLGMYNFGQLMETRMTQEEVEMFEEDWNKLWNPQTQPILTENL